MAKASSIPVRNRSNTIHKPIIPTITSFIFTSTNLHKITDENQALNETADSQAIGYRVKRQEQGGGNLSGPHQVTAQNKEVPADENEEDNTYQSRHYIETVSDTPGERIDQKVYKNMPPVPGCNGDTESYYDSATKTYQLKSADDWMPEKPQHNITHCKQHNECERSGCNRMHPIA